MPSKPNVVRVSGSDALMFGVYHTRELITDEHVAALHTMKGVNAVDRVGPYAVTVWRSQAYTWDEIDAVVREVLEPDPEPVVKRIRDLAPGTRFMFRGCDGVLLLTNEQAIPGKLECRWSIPFSGGDRAVAVGITTGVVSYPLLDATVVPLPTGGGA